MRIPRAIPVRSTPNFAFVVDGGCEIWYLQMLKRNERSLLVNIEPRIPQKKSLHDQFEMVKSMSEYYTKVFWIVDLDTVLEETRKAKRGDKMPIHHFADYRSDLAKAYANVVVIVNNPCIEFWLLLHFESSTKYFESCDNAVRQLKKHLNDYEKSKRFYTRHPNDIYLRLKPLLLAAIRNAKKAGGFDLDNLYKGLAEMHLLFETEEFDGHFQNKK